MEYVDFTATEFAADPFFQQWVLTSDKMADTFWKTWLEKHPGKQSEVEQARRLIQGVRFTPHYPSGPEFHQVWQDIMTHRATGHYKVKRPSHPHRWYVAASLLVLGLLSFLWFRMPMHNPWLVAYQTPYGEKQEITLPDGSLVTLGAHSQLYYPRQWAPDKPRRVTLEGEAYFSVTHQANNQKFIVQSGPVAIEVLGTRFNVNNRRGGNQVLLEEGSIRLDVSDLDIFSSEEPAILMEPGEVVEITNRHIVRKTVNATPYVAWTQGVFVFHQATLREVIQVVEDQYGYTITAPGVAMDEPVFTAELRTTEPAIMLRYLSEVFDLTIVQNDRQITLSPR